MKYFNDLKEMYNDCYYIMDKERKEIVSVMDLLDGIATEMKDNTELNNAIDTINVLIGEMKEASKALQDQ